MGPMQEIARDGAFYFDPFNPDEIGRAVLRYWNDGPARAALSEQGIKESARYSWDLTAQRMLGIFEEAAA